MGKAMAFGPTGRAGRAGRPGRGAAAPASAPARLASVAAPRPRRESVLYVHDAPVPSPAANAVQVVKMCQAFQAAGAETTLVVPRGSTGARGYASIADLYGLDRDARFTVRDVAAMRLPGRALIYGAAALLGGGTLLGGRTGAEAVVFTRSISVAAMAARLGRAVAIEAHLPLAAWRPALARRFRWLVRQRRFRLLVVISDRLRQDYECTMPELAGRIVVAHDGAEPLRGAVVPAPLEGGFKVGYAGHLYPGKGMEIIAPLARRCPWATFHIVGGREADVARWRSELADADNVVFHGHVPHAEVPGCIAAMHVVLAPYLRNVSGVGGGGQNLADWMSPLKIFEYMAHAKPILASDLPVLREVLRDGETALMRAPEDLDGWVEAITRLRADARLRERLGAAARDDLVAHYSWDRRARLILDALGADTRRAAVSR